ncbi:hypothetical protein [Campylobacter pinnipediorum]|uniref:Uncharacterized protein n=1 Tax=Campylobacter pinnipediorum subsp. pinnipediorum TaxID=1660067 RepID=A0AAX0L9D2_9BACT|nr:hypothetical protein [Campylobacter pinnipediorum]AQW81979.1 hypothetical protein CPIN17260_1711 [Campylobacter pinnipediorum subsp. pinnipediorum]AQW83650.1 hypothetical protein CPIN17261_1665 [Campylobacter pinnipediorum subsp. pinnipediorum]AQW85172.1 hypothetical protein CPIN17262_1511 [Campylobacter pinnipediorum subsp. pinnipediorum]OPA75861.1 hypothetical protein BFG04_05295 [Campylobacter pinnipediorum subsp. pinnipediorum]OPA76028.1 hypothetical protein BFG05_05710 [Campylobacter p
MNEKVFELFENKKILLRNLQKLNLSEFTKIRTISAYFGVDMKGFYTIVFISVAKSRFMKKNYIFLDDICDKYEKKFDTAIKKRILFYKSNICSKTLHELKSNSWRCYDFV